MKKKIYNAFCIMLLFVLFGITLFCIFDGNEAKAETKKVTSSKTVYVDIKGAVNNPGVYEVDNGSRVIDVIKIAGDLKENADTSIINLSKIVTDEMYIIVYTVDEMKSYKEKMIPAKTIVKEVEKKIICPDDSNDACINQNNSNSSISGKININSATKEELSTLPSIGESKAQNIIDYRSETSFETIDDIKNVKGIGDSLFEKIKDYIEV